MATYEYWVWRGTQIFVHFGVDDLGAYQVRTPGYIARGADNINQYVPAQLELCDSSDCDHAMRAHWSWIELAVTTADKFGFSRILDDDNKRAGTIPTGGYLVPTAVPIMVVNIRG
ncbi:hypothetical protein [Lacticaseibacillus hegangensis]|uniref:Uncharacterized protein n=1 Tax=Lacticaseibacillus hegangensis TaxID=2486010 RepID=A0ABW4D152_9LACO|nr:hypothetical protein [Lacticaseibacillus hegangensis]